MTYFKDLELEIREMDFNGMPLQAIADRVGLSVPQVLRILDQIDEDPYNYAEVAADLDAEHYGRM
jgi:DNA-binding Lrp family transcriptional regulator